MNSVCRLCLAAAILAVAAQGYPSRGMAQDLVKTTTVLDRQRPELDPQGARVGSFLLFPKATVAVTHDDNIFRTETGTVDDIITVVTPSLRLDSNWNRHRLGLSASADIGRYADRNAEDYDDYKLNLNGQVDITRRANVTGGLSYDKLHEDRGSPDNANGVNPTEYTVKKLEAAFTQRFNRVAVQIGTEVSQFDYDDVRTSGGTPVNNDDRDRDEKLGFIRLGYEITPSYEAFIKASVNDRSYDSATDDNGYRRDSDGYEVNGGVRLDLGGVTFGDIFAGYRAQEYEDSRFSKISGMSYGASLTWNATQLTTAKLTIARSIGETTQSGVSGTWDTSYTVSVDHELLRNMLVGAKAGFSNSEFRGATREDDTTSAQIYAKYLLSRYVYLRASYDYISRDSSTANSDYDDNRFMVRLEGQF